MISSPALWTLAQQEWRDTYDSHQNADGVEDMDDNWRKEALSIDQSKDQQGEQRASSGDCQL